MARAQGGGTTGWVQPVVGILFAVIFISVLVGVAYIVLVDVGNTLQGTTGANTNFGNTGQSAVAGYNSVASYIATLVSFIGIIILLAIIAIVLFVLSMAFGWFGAGMGGGATR